MRNPTKKISFAMGLLIICSTAIAIPLLNPNPPSPNIPQLLGWVPLPACENICCGYYQDPLASFATVALPPLSTTPAEASGAQGSFSQTGPTSLIGNVVVTQPGRLITGDEAVINRDPRTFQPSTLDIRGNVTLREPGRLVIADSGHIDLQTKSGKLLNTIYHFVLGGAAPFSQSDLVHTAPPLVTDINPLIKPLDAWGVASSVERLPNGHIVLKNATYTTCAPTSNTWRVHAWKIHLDTDSERGSAYNTWLTVKGIPVFYTPYLNFPLDRRRKTGFLFPQYGNDNRAGYNWALPFYWNIAPNYDATFTPTYYTKRGFFMDGLFRYLTSSSTGNITGGYLPHDSAFTDFMNDTVNDPAYASNPALDRLRNASAQRGYFSWQNITHFNPHWTSNVDFNYVSDDYFLEDFNKINTLVPNQLPQRADLIYRDDIWTFSSMVRAYQTLHPVNQAAVTNPYQSLPQIDLNADLPNQAYGLHYQLNTQYVYFDRNRNPKETIDPLNANRINIQPIISWPHTSMSGFFTPKLQFVATDYEIGHQVPGYSREEKRFLPIFDIDTGLYFDRDVWIFNNQYQQTLEPRIFYLYVPYVNQDNLPLFDTALIPFSYDSLFLTNRFSGWDRIGDANQVAVGLTSRFLDSTTGAEKFKASLGQIYYFQNRRVSSCPFPGTPAAASYGSASTDPTSLIGSNSPREVASPFAGQLTYHFNPSWSAVANGVWDPNYNQVINANMNLQYSPAPNHIVNINYNYVHLGDPIPGRPPLSSRNDLSMLGGSLAWPIRDHWQVVGSLNYDLVHGYPQTFLYGVEYDSCCWAIRFVAGRTLVGLNPHQNPVFNHAYYVQWQLKGLGNINRGNPASFLLNNIPGYQDIFDNFSIL